MKVYQDVFVEQLVRRQRPGGETMFKLGTVFAGLVLITAAFLLAKNFFPVLFALVIILEFFAFVYTVKEYEYSFINGDVDIDKILGRRKRSTVLSVSCKEITAMAPCAGHESTLQGSFTRTVDAAIGAKASDRWYFISERQDGSRELVYLSPNDRLLAAFKGYLGRKMEYTLPEEQVPSEE